MSKSQISSDKKLKQKRQGKLFLVIALVSVFTIIILSGIQSFIVSKISKNKISEQVELQYETLSEQVAFAYANHLETYLGYMDFYANADVVRNGGSTQEIVDWLRSESVVSVRNKGFAYIAYVEANGNSYIDIKKGSNVKDRDYFQAIMNGADYFIDSPVPAKATGKLAVHICKAVKQNGKTVGLFYGNMDPTTLSDVLENIKLGDNGFAAIFGGNGHLIGTSIDDDDVKAEIENIKNTNSEDYSKIEEIWKTDKEYINEINYKGRRTFVVGAPIKHTEWNFSLFLYEEELFETSTVVTKALVVGMIALVILVVLVIGIVLFVSIKPLGVVEKTIRGIANGDADLTKRIDIKVNNEIGRVVEGFNLFSEKLQVIIATMKNSKDELVNAGQLLHDSTDDTSAAINQIIENIDTMSANVNTQTDSVHQTAGAVNEIASNIESLNRMIESQVSSVTEASAAVEEMIGNINSVNNSVKKMANSFGELEEKTITGIQRQNDVNIKISEIETESQALQEANAVISGIAEQTNLLAMNAAIEAAHAGDAGKGFSVVADEIRKLSEDSSSQSQTIGNQLSKITNTIQEIVTASQFASEAFNEVSNGINSTNNLVREITCAMEEQNAGSQQISIALHEMNDTSNEVKTASYEMAEGNKAILAEIKSLQDATFSIKDGMDEMSASARKINETGNALSDIAKNMDDSINNIGEQVDKFKV